MKLQEYLIQLNPMSLEKANLIASYFNKEIKQKGTLLIKEGRTSKKSYFVAEGIIRCYIVDMHGNEVTTRFYNAPDFLNDYLSFFKQKPSEENYELITDAVLWSVNFDNVQYCFHHIPEFREWGRMLLTTNYVTLHKKMISFHKNTAQERYVQLLENHPEIITKVPLHIIASYLGITKYSLSRIRKDIENTSELS